MSSGTLKRSLDLARELLESERAVLAHDVIASLDGPADADAQQVWGAEMAKRLDELEDGKAHMINVDEGLRRVDARLQRGG